MVSLFKALISVGFEKVAPRTLKRGEVTVSVKFGRDVKWVVVTPSGTFTYYSQRSALHGLVIRNALTREDLEIMSMMGLEYAREELEKLGSARRKVDGSENLRRIKSEFIKQVVYPLLLQVLLNNDYQCPICGEVMESTHDFFLHLNASTTMRRRHREFMKELTAEVTGERV
ncbi:MAG: hypothetical protein MPF33_06425 [Candidatus Aramenus sp.]|nr:hypothetical protein [Candidatus Aramenus sp.]